MRVFYKERKSGHSQNAAARDEGTGRRQPPASHGKRPGAGPTLMVLRRNLPADI